jgi:hypothetical protein
MDSASKLASHVVVVLIVHLDKLAMQVNVILRITQQFLLKAPLAYVQKHMGIAILEPVVTMMVDSLHV